MSCGQWLIQHHKFSANHNAGKAATLNMLARPRGSVPCNHLLKQVAPCRSVANRKYTGTRSPQPSRHKITDHKMPLATGALLQVRMRCLRGGIYASSVCLRLRVQIKQAEVFLFGALSGDLHGSRGTESLCVRLF